MLVLKCDGHRTYRENSELSVISTPSAGYKLGILNSDGDEKPKRGDSSGLKHGSSEGESDHRVSGVVGEFVNDGNGDEWQRSSTLKKSSHEVEYGCFSVWLEAAKRVSSHAPGCSGNSGGVSAGKSTISEGRG